MTGSIRTAFFAASVIIAGFTGTLRAEEDPAAAQKEAVAAIRRATTNLQFNRDGTARLARFSRPHVTDEHLAPLAELTTLDYLAVVCPQVTDAGLTHVQGLTKLDTLYVSQTQLSSNGLAYFKDLTLLERLYVDGTQVTDAGLAHLAGLENLHTLSVCDTAITDEALSHIGKLASLQTLLLDGTGISDAGLEHLAGLKNLKTLYLARTELKGDGLMHLAKLPALEVLGLSSTHLAGDALPELEKFSGLKQLELYHTPLASDCLAQLRAALPKVAIYPATTAEERIAALESSTNQLSNVSPPVTVSTAGQLLPPANERFPSTDEIPDFQRHVIPLLGRLGCNGRNCHGSFQGRGGFRLSMFGYDFDLDHKALAGGDEPRVDLKTPEESLILNKPTSEDNHGGGLRYEKGGWQYHLLRQWVAAGAKNVAEDRPKFVRLEVTPSDIVFNKAGDTVQLRVIAVWSDGSREDVTCLTRFQSNDEAVCQVDENGLIRSSGAGDTYVISFYDNGIFSTEVVRPVTDRIADRYPQVPAPTPIDRHVVAKLSKLGIVPSDVCSDEEFLRRVSLDLIGTLPTPQEVADFVADTSSDKRNAKIDQLLAHPAYVIWWTTRLCDLTGSNAGYLGGTEMAQPVAEQWRQWIERRVRDNVGYDKIVEGIVLARSRRPGQTYQEFIAEQSTYTRRTDPADYAAPDNCMPHFWARSNVNQPEDKALSFGYTFLGVRLECAQCHKHPYDQWSQQDFQQFTEFFARVKSGVAPDAAVLHRQMQERLAVPVKLNTAALRRQSYLRVAAEGKPIPWTEVFITPATEKDRKKRARLLGGDEVDLARYDDPREPLMQWLKDPENNYFAKAFVNRIWANYFNVGIVQPPDDLNLANPPSNKRLLDYLVREFIAHDYDIKWLHREIASSRTYQLSWRPNDTNRRDERNFSHAILRRLPAEVIVDGLIQATVAEKQLGSTDVKNRKIGQHPRSYQARAIDYSLLIFGKPLRTVTCDCERRRDPTLLQALYVRNDTDMYQMLDRADGWLAELTKQFAAAKKNAGGERASPDQAALEQWIESAYLRTLSRSPQRKEVTESLSYLQESESTIDGIRDLMWALLNTQEFITNH